ncbi:MAG: peptide chain release factor 2 [Chloroflexi bacterium]|nr:peptide chain release factor 2 [Chloroflexota bacterium]
MDDLREKLNDLQQRIQQIMVRLDIAGRQEQIAALEQRSAQPDFWDDPQSAQATMQELTRLREDVELWNGLSEQVKELSGLLELAAAEDDQSIAEEIESATAQIEEKLETLEFQLRMSGEHDAKDAILAIHAGAGGTESQDWAAMLLRMYLRWAEDHGYKATIIDSTPGEEAGIKSVTVTIEGRYAYGYLRAERGVHRLVRLSPFDSAHRRHTSFALVEVIPDIGEDVEVEIKPDDVKMEVFRASSAGGQHMQKNATAVRLIHIPTGIVATCQNERSQMQNRETAMKVLRARLYEIERQKKEEEKARLKGEHISAGWGNQIRSYVLHPYQMVKDLRTGHETGNANAVLDGELDSFIEAYLRDSMGEERD